MTTSTLISEALCPATLTTGRVHSHVSATILRAIRVRSSGWHRSTPAETPAAAAVVAMSFPTETVPSRKGRQSGVHHRSRSACHELKIRVSAVRFCPWPLGWFSWEKSAKVCPTGGANRCLPFFHVEGAVEGPIVRALSLRAGGTHDSQDQSDLHGSRR